MSGVMKREGERTNRRSGRRRGVAAPVVFAGALMLGLVGMGVSYVLRGWFVLAAAAACLGIALALYVNDRKGFLRRRQMRRAFEARGHFNLVEVAVLGLLFLGNAFVLALVLLK